MARPAIEPGGLGMVSARPRGRTWQARAKARNYGGALVLLSASGATEEAALLAIEREYQRVVIVSHSGLSQSSTISDAIEAWLSERRAAVSAGTLKRQSLEKYTINAKTAQQLMGAVPLHKAKTAMLQPMIEHLTITRGPSYARGIQFVLKNAFSIAVRREAMERNPLSDAPSLRGSRKIHSALQPAQWLQMRESITQWGQRPRTRADWQKLIGLCEVALGTSMRIGEVTALRPCDLRTSGTVVGVAVTGTIVEVDGRLLRQSVPKREGQERVIPLPRQVATTLSGLAARSSGPNALLFGTESGGPDGNTNRLMATWRTSPEGRAWQEMTDVPETEVTFKLLRRSAARFIRGVEGLDAAQALLGHANSKTTEGYAGLPVLAASTARHLESMWNPEVTFD